MSLIHHKPWGLNHQLEVKKYLQIGVSPKEVWHALTDRETIKKYFFGTEAISDWSGFPGLEDFPENYALVSYILGPGGEGTDLNLSQKGFANEQGAAHGNSGWEMVLQNQKKLLGAR